jgi:hypothetical protein
MVAGIIGPASLLFDDDSFCIPRVALYFWIHIVLAIATAKQPSFTILKRLATDVSREGCTLVLLNGFQQIFGFLEEGPSQLDAVDREAAWHCEELALRFERMGQRQTVRPVQTMDRRWGSLCDCRTEVH